MRKSNIRWWLAALGVLAAFYNSSSAFGFSVANFTVHVIFNFAIWYFIGLAIDRYREKRWNQAPKLYQQVGEIYKRCPFCAEKILYEAVVCKHCGKDLPMLEVARRGDKDE